MFEVAWISNGHMNRFRQFAGSWSILKRPLYSPLSFSLSVVEWKPCTICIFSNLSGNPAIFIIFLSLLGEGKPSTFYNYLPPWKGETLEVVELIWWLSLYQHHHKIPGYTSNTKQRMEPWRGNHYCSRKAREKNSQSTSSAICKLLFSYFLRRV